MNVESILKLAKECGLQSHVTTKDNYPAATEAFYRAAFNAGLEAAAKKCLNYDERYRYNYGTEFAKAILALEMKP